MPAPFVDTNVLLYLLSDDGAKADRAEALLAERIVVSVQVLNEFANVARHKMALDWPTVEQALADVHGIADQRVIDAGDGLSGMIELHTSPKMEPPPRQSSIGGGGINCTKIGFNGLSTRSSAWPRRTAA